MKQRTWNFRQHHRCRALARRMQIFRNRGFTISGFDDLKLFNRKLNNRSLDKGRGRYRVNGVSDRTYYDLWDTDMPTATRARLKQMTRKELEEYFVGAHSDSGHSRTG